MRLAAGCRCGRRDGRLGPASRFGRSRAGSVASPGEGFNLGVPQIPGDSEAVQHEHERAVGGTGDPYVEHQAGGGEGAGQDH